MAQCAACVPRVYNGVIDDVINSVREFFLDEGVDEQVLTELKQSWEQKLQRMNVIDNSEPGSNPPAPAPTSPQPVVHNLVPVQITVPAQQAGGVPKTITIHVPSSALANGIAGQQLQTILSSPNAAHTFALESSRAAEIIQRKLNQALEENGITLPPQLQQYNNTSTTQVDGPCEEPLQLPHISMTEPVVTKTKVPVPSQVEVAASSSSSSSQVLHPAIHVDRQIMDRIVLQRLQETQVDGMFGTGDSSSEISDDDEDDDEDNVDDDKKSVDGEDEDDEPDEGPEEEPLNTDDDVSDDDNSEIFETDNVVVCQYDKITRVRNKWKFTLKDGIMNLKGKDYVFQKATGEGEW